MGHLCRIRQLGNENEKFSFLWKDLISLCISPLCSQPLCSGQSLGFSHCKDDGGDSSLAADRLVYLTSGSVSGQSTYIAFVFPSSAVLLPVEKQLKIPLS